MPRVHHRYAPRLLYAEPLRRRMRVQFADDRIAGVRPGVLLDENRTTKHRDLGDPNTSMTGVSLGVDGGESLV